MCTPLTPGGSPWASSTTRTALPTWVSMAVPTTCPPALRSSAWAVLSAGVPVVAHPAASNEAMTTAMALMPYLPWVKSRVALASGSAAGSRRRVEVRAGPLHQAGIGQQIVRRHRHRLGRLAHALAGEGRHRGGPKGARVDRGAGGAEPVGEGGGLDGADRRHVRPEEAEQRVVALERLVRRLEIDDLDATTGRHRRALRARDHAAAEVPHVVEASGPDVKRAGRVLGDDVGGGSPGRDDSVDPRVGPHLLAQHAHVVEGLDDGVERVDAFPGIGGGVDRKSTRLEAHAHDAEQVLVQDPAVEAVDHHGCVDVAEDPALDQLDL